MNNVAGLTQFSKLSESNQYQRAPEPTEQQPSGQVIDAMLRLEYSLNATEDIVQSLLRRMVSVTGDLSSIGIVGEKAQGTAMQNAPVPLAYAVETQVKRIDAANALLDRILSNMQI